MEILKNLFFLIAGISSILLIAYALSSNRKAIRSRPILWGLGLQIGFGILVLYWPLGHQALLKVSNGVSQFLGFASEGSKFLFGNLGNPGHSVSPLFWAGDFNDIKSLAIKFRKDPDKISLHLKQKFSPTTQILLGQWDADRPLPADLQGLFISELNNIIQDKLLYDAKLFEGITLSRRVMKLMEVPQEGENLTRLNRFLLEELYPKEIKGYQNTPFGFQFAFIVLCTIIFFSSFMSILYHYGIMQKIVSGMAYLMSKSMGTSGSESLVAAANVFVGQTEAPLIVKPFINSMTLSEINAVMVSGFGTIAGGVMAGYIAMGVPAQYIITASLMAAPASLMVAKILFPETEESVTAKQVKVELEIPTKNGIEAAAKGASDGLSLALNVGAMLVAFIALISLLDAGLKWMDYLVDNMLFSALGATVAQDPRTGEFLGIVPGSIRTILSILLWPLAWLMGVPYKDCSHFAYLVGIKISLNEFFAYIQFSNMMKIGEVVDQKTIAMATFALCGFANFSSIAIQIGGITPMVSGTEQDNLRSKLAKLGIRAMLGGAMVSCLTATIAGFLLGL